ncbi:hypothetical protein GQ457_13G026480 [Hibiscus cannabinus]
MMHGYERISSTDASKGGKFDLESGETLYPGLSYAENELRWAFVRKVYGILAAQLLLTTIVFVVAVLSPPINDLLQLDPCSGVALAYLANTDGRIVLEALILTAAVVSPLSGYTFWASKNGEDFNYLGPILFSSLIIILILTSLIQCPDFLWLHSLRHRLPDQALHSSDNLPDNPCFRKASVMPSKLPSYSWHVFSVGDGDRFQSGDTFTVEVCMTELDRVMARKFFKTSHDSSAAKEMTELARIDDINPRALICDFEFDPCG